MRAITITMTMTSDEESGISSIVNNSEYDESDEKSAFIALLQLMNRVYGLVEDVDDLLSVILVTKFRSQLNDAENNANADGDESEENDYDGIGEGDESESCDDE